MRYIVFDKITGKIVADMTIQDTRALASYTSATRGVMLISDSADLSDVQVDISTGLLMDIPNVATFKTQAATTSAKAAVEDDYAQTLTGYVTTPHGAFSIAPDSLARLNGALLAATVDPSRFVDWRLDAGGVIPLGYADLVIIHTTAMDAIAGIGVVTQSAIAALDNPA